jgi:cytochrome c5
MGKCLISPTKQRYLNQRAAAIASRQIEFTSGKRLYEYQCAGCNGWHLSSSVPTGAKR